MVAGGTLWNQPCTVPYVIREIQNIERQDKPVVATSMQTQVKALPAILIAEDSRFLRKATEIILCKAGYTVYSAADGDEALHLARMKKPQLIILDLMMPKLNGIEVVRALKQSPELAAIPVVVISGLAQTNDKKLVREGVTAYYEKTKLVPEALIDIVKQGLESAGKTDGSPSNSTSESSAVTDSDERETFRAGAGDREYEQQIFEQLIAVNNELLAAQQELAKANAELRKISSVDELTGLSTRRKGAEDLKKLLSLARRHRQHLCVGLLDVDNFKSINDRFGHAAGDAILRSFGGLLLSSFRAEDVTARWGGEEFLIALYDCSLEEAGRRMDEIRREFSSKRFVFDDHRVQVTLSAGVVAYPEAGDELESICHAADTLLYAAKRCGRNQVIAAKEVEAAADSDVEENGFKSLEQAAIRICEVDLPAASTVQN
jgi:diguanylate cyclase (GGDEF)-like protein